MDAVLSDPNLNYLEPREIVLLAKKLSIFTAGPSSLTAAEKELYKAADQTARDMEELMKLAPAAKPTKIAAAPSVPAVTASAAADDADDDDEWRPDVPPAEVPKKKKPAPIVDDDDDLDLT
jgi:hypothetical protein